jgi:hypothetical protein
MSTEMLDYSISSNLASIPSSDPWRITITLQNDWIQPTATLGRERLYSGRDDIIVRLMDLARRSPNLQPRALGRAAAWIFGLPGSLPDPFVAIGDDGSISAEWDIGKNSLHVTFADDGDEVYHLTSAGEEWESALDATDKISSAMRVIALAYVRKQR